MKTLKCIVALAVSTGLATAASAQTDPLYGLEYGGAGQLLDIDASTGSSFVIGGLPGLDEGTGIAYNPVTKEVVARDFNEIAVVDPATGNTSNVRPSHAGSDLLGLEFSMDYSVAYSVGRDGALYSVDPVSGAAALIGGSGLGTATDLSMDRTSGTLWGADAFSGEFFIIDPNTGGKSSQFFAPEGMTSLAFDSLGDLYAVGISSDNLFQIDKFSGATNLVGGPMATSDVVGLTFVPAPGTAALFGLAGVCAVRRRR
jgi:hypothetical protein